MPDDLPDRLLALLSKERSVLRTGALAELPAIGAQKDTLTAALENAKVSESHIRRIAAALQINATLLAAARDGVNAASGRLGALRAVRDGLSLYTADGTRQTVAQTPTGLEHKV